MNEIKLSQSGIYEIVSPSGKRYVGSAVCFRKRWQRHKRLLTLGIHHCPGLQSAYTKYTGRLDYVVIELCPAALLIEREQVHMDALRGKLYNAAPQAGSRRGVPVTEETRARISAAHKGRKFTEEHKASISAAKRGKAFSKQHCVTMGLARRGKTLARNTSGYAGVSHTEKAGVWKAEIKLNGRKVYFGRYRCPELAHQQLVNFYRILDYYSHS